MPFWLCISKYSFLPFLFCLFSLSQIDDFVANLYDIYLTVRREGIAQPVSLGLHRCDYLLHVPLDVDPETTVPVIKQVEFNTISSSFGSLSTLTGQMHR